MNNDNALPAICYGEVLWDVLPDGPQPGGAPLNVAYHLNKLGVSTSVISRIGLDNNGKKLEGLMDKWGIDKQLLQRDPTYPTSEVIAKMNDSNEVSYEIIFPVAWDFINQVNEIEKYLRQKTYLIYGSLASRNEITRNTLLELLKTDAVKVFDINLRPPFVNKGLLEVLLQGADIAKFNEAELEMMQGFFGGFYVKEIDQIKFIQNRFDIARIIVTKGQFGASYYTPDKAYHVAGPEVKVTDTIGSGDSFLAAFIASHYLGHPPLTTLKNAIAMGAFIATQKGGCPEYEVTDFENFKQKIFKPI